MGLALDKPNENEDVIQVNGIKVLITSEIKTFADRNTIDYVNSPYGEGFVITPPGHSCC